MSGVETKCKDPISGMAFEEASAIIAMNILFALINLGKKGLKREPDIPSRRSCPTLL
jgi:hypothetical protein